MLYSLQGLWAAPRLQDVEGLERGSIVHHLGVMALAVCVSALLIGTATDHLRRVGLGGFDIADKNSTSRCRKP